MTNIEVLAKLGFVLVVGSLLFSIFIDATKGNLKIPMNVRTGTVFCFIAGVFSLAVAFIMMVSR